MLNYAVAEYDSEGAFQGREVSWDTSKETCRRSFCLEFQDAQKEGDVEMIRSAIYYNKESIYGGIGFSESTLVFDGVPKTYILSQEPEGLETWLIPYICTFVLVAIGIAYNIYASMSAPKVDPYE